MSKREILYLEIVHLELTFTLNVSFELRCMFEATDTDWLMLDICFIRPWVGIK